MNSQSKLVKKKAQDDLLSAVAAVKNGSSFLQASKDHGVPYITLH